jgi:hypothetical protein
VEEHTENYAHFGLASGAEQGGLQNLEDIIGRITEVLPKPRPAHPILSREIIPRCDYDKILAQLKKPGFIREWKGACSRSDAKRTQRGDRPSR